MKRRNHKGGVWKPYTPSYSNGGAVNNPFAGLKFVRIVQKDAIDSTSVSSEHNVKKFKPPIGPKHLPLSQCPNLAALLHQRDRFEMEKIAKSLLAKPHDNGFKITLEPGARLEVREIYGERQETFASWYIVVYRNWEGIKGNRKSFKSEYSLRVDDNRVLASVLYLADLLNAKTDKIHLFKPFRPSAYIEAWLDQEKSKNPALVAKMKEVAGKVYVYQKDGALSASGMKPVALFVGSTEYSLKNWRDLIVKTCDILDKENRKLLRELSFRIGDAFLSEKSDGMRTPKLHESSGLYMEMNLPAYSHILHSQLLFRKFQYNLDEIGIVYVDKGGDTDSSESRSRRRTTTREPRGIVYSEPVSEELRKVKEVIWSFFKSGIRANSIIDQNRFRRSFSEMHGEPLRLDFDFACELKKIGFEHEGKIYVQAEASGKECNEFIRGLISGGHRIFNFSRVIDLHASTLMPLGISSAEMLEKFMSTYSILSSIRNGVEDECWRPSGEAYYRIYKNWFVPIDGLFDLNAVVLNDLDEGALFVSEDDLCEKYPYVEPELIHRMLTSGLNYVWNEGRVYAISDRIAFDEKEVDCMRRIVVEGVRATGYFSQAHIVLFESAALNDSKLSEFALRKVFVEKFLSDEYERHGQIISKRGSDVDALVPLREFCKQNVEVTMEQLENVMTEYNIHKGYGISKVKEMMVRIDVNRFVSPDLVEFDVLAIDQAVETLWFGSAMGIGAFVNFSGFPAVSGYAWTPYLFESFLQRESKSFRILNPRAGAEGTKRRIAGAVVRISAEEKDAYEVFAKAATESRIEPNSDAVGNFLFNNAFISNRSAKTIHKVIDLMQVIYEGKKHA